MAPDRSLNSAFGRVLRELRTLKKLTQEELAHRSNLHRTYISDLERGLKSPSLAALDHIAAALDTKPHSLVRLAEDQRNGS